MVKHFATLAYFLEPQLFHVVCLLINTLQLVYGVCSLHWLLSDALEGHRSQSESVLTCVRRQVSLTHMSRS